MFSKTPSAAPSPPSPSTPSTRRFTDAPETPANVIGPGTRIKGELNGAGPLDFAGTLEGPCHVTGHCIVREGGRIVGDVSAASIVVEGELTGTTLSAERVEIGMAARVRANVRARVVAIAEGAFFDGEVHMEGGGPAAPIAFKEKRKGERQDVP